MRQDRVGILFGVVAGVALVTGGLIADIIGLLLGKAHDLLVAGKDHGLLLSVGNDAVGLLLGIVEALLLFLHDAAGIEELLREDPADLVDDLKDILRIDDLLLRSSSRGP